MSATSIIDPRSTTTYFKYVYLAIDSNGKPTYPNPDSTLQSINDAFRIIFTNVTTFNNELYNSQTWNSTSLAIMDNLKKIINIMKPCASSTDINKCSKDICKYVPEIQVVFNAYTVILMLVTSPKIKSKYTFLPFYSQYYLIDAVTSNPNNQQFGTYYLCGDSSYQPKSDDPDMMAQYQALMTVADTQLTTVQNENAIYTYFVIAIIIVVLIIVIFIIKYFFFNNNKTKLKI